jgi:hypothetical protein
VDIFRVLSGLARRLGCLAFGADGYDTDWGSSIKAKIESLNFDSLFLRAMSPECP